jgi:hypothetical protein
MDGYLDFAKVVCDVNENGIYDAGEPVTYTSNNGNGKFTFNPGCTHGMLGGVDGTGTNADTKLPFVGLLRAPAGATVLSPLTTLLSSGMSAADIITALNLPAGTNLLTTDPGATNPDGSLKDAMLLKKSLAMQQLLQKTTELVNGLAHMSGSVATQTVYTQVAIALATTLKGGTPLITGGNTPVISATVVKSMLTTAMTNIASAASVDPAIKTALAATGGAVTLPTVVAPALTAEAQALLDASSTAITATTLSRQGNTAITVTVVAAAATLSPTTSPAALSALAAATLAAAQAAPPITPTNHVAPPAAGSTTLFTFDETPPAFTSMGAYGGALPNVEAGPSSDAGNALRIVKPVDPVTWGGVYFTANNAIPFTATQKKITAAVYATKANAVIKFKVELADKTFVEVVGTTTGAANTWSTVTWDLSAVDTSKVYKTIAITPDADVVTSGQSYYFDYIALAPATAVTPTNYLYVAGNAIGFSPDGTTGSTVNYSMAAFQSSGINVKWPMSNGAAIKLNLAENGTFNMAAGQTLSAAVQIEDITAGSSGQIRAYTDGVTVTKSGSNITLNVPNLPQALIYGVSGNGNTKAVINFASKVQGISNILSTAANAVSTVMFGEVVNFGITGLSNDFTNMSALRGQYKVTIVVNQLPLRKADGTLFDSLTIQMPTTVQGGVAGGIVPVTGYGLVGYINLTN